MSSVEILGVDRWKRTVTIRKRPQSMRELVEALYAYWKDNEMEFPIAEVLRSETPIHLFYVVNWIEE